jgi:hypothetical protein
MKFKLSTARSYGYDSHEERADLEQLGFKFNENGRLDDANTLGGPELENCPELEINTIHELIEFIKKYGAIVLEERESENLLTIYNGYLE